MTLLGFARIGFGLLFVFITYLTLTPNPEDMDSGMAITRWISERLFGDPVLGDKVAHFAAYGALGAAAVFAHVRFFGSLAYTAIALAVYGAALEGLQGMSGLRSPELADATANALGVLVAVPIALLFVTVCTKFRRS